jgi:hypothetical protein
MKPTIAMLHLALVLVACQRNESSIVVSLQPDLVDTASDQPLWGLTNIFFAEPNEETLSARLRIADHWDDVEIAEVLALEGMDPATSSTSTATSTCGMNTPWRFG